AWSPGFRDHDHGCSLCDEGPRRPGRDPVETTGSVPPRRLRESDPDHGAAVSMSVSEV
ncbi:MAG: hypothetical protein AVDCRST_MAG70-647, partial [uncultured Thermomicrobiales bacterium]